MVPENIGIRECWYQECRYQRMSVLENVGVRECLYQRMLVSENVCVRECLYQRMSVSENVCIRECQYFTSHQHAVSISLTDLFSQVEVLSLTDGSVQHVLSLTDGSVQHVLSLTDGSVQHVLSLTDESVHPDLRVVSLRWTWYCKLSHSFTVI